MKRTGIHLLRAHAIAQTLFPPTTLKAAIKRLGFVQADPIRSPARAQDLILRHRVKAYRAGDLERRYASLDIEEDVLYAYGFLPRTTWRLLHPRKMTGLSKMEEKVYETVCRLGVIHPREMETHFGRERVVNAWGGHSKATTRALEALHYRGLLRIARREQGIRVYEVASSSVESVPPLERLRRLTMVIASILAPVPQRTLQTNITRYRRLGDPRAVVADLIREGKLQQQTIEGMTYVWPPCSMPLREDPPRVRFLAPFDPVVWDRRRFEHLWGWPYRFEAYTPPSKRIRGYYAMPLLWGDKVIGWANAQVSGGQLNVEVGFVGKRPSEKRFRSELELEIGRLDALKTHW
ncbi:MAG: crosslink repair DNA glycosylase YcaQ family protein [Candidatus Eisenbacteria bacterium]